MTAGAGAPRAVTPPAGSGGRSGPPLTPAVPCLGGRDDRTEGQADTDVGHPRNMAGARSRQERQHEHGGSGARTTGRTWTRYEVWSRPAPVDLYRVVAARPGLESDASCCCTSRRGRCTGTTPRSRASSIRGRSRDLPTTPPERDADSRAVLRSALAVLLPRQRAAVVLRDVADLDDAAVAAALGCSVSTVRSQISRVLAWLRQEPVPVPARRAAMTDAPGQPLAHTKDDNALRAADRCCGRGDGKHRCRARCRGAGCRPSDRAAGTHDCCSVATASQGRGGPSGLPSAVAPLQVVPDSPPPAVAVLSLDPRRQSVAVQGSGWSLQVGVGDNADSPPATASSARTVPPGAATSLSRGSGSRM